MPERPFTLLDGETLLQESGDAHLLRPKRALIARLCRAYLTDRRIILCEAFYDVHKGEMKGLGDVLREVPLPDVVDVQAESLEGEPNIAFTVRAPEGGEEPLVLFFRDKGWHLGAPVRLEERDAWLRSLHQGRRRLPQRPMPGAPPKTLPLAAQPMRAVEAGQVVGGKYQVLRKIGEGGMGLVYKGMDTTLERPVAIKQMRPELQTMPRDKSAFLREAKTSASLHHPFIVDIYEILEEGDEVFLVFEFVEGKTVDQLLDEKERLAPSLVRRVLRDVCEALAYAHSRKFAHRDLKPSNIIVTPQGHAKVMDFGIARMVKDTTSRVTSVDTSGTLAYMAPEQELGKSTFRSDLFALGATAYEMLSGDRPFPGPNYYLQKEQMSFRPILEQAPDVPRELAAGVERCLHFDAKQRFQTAEEFARAIGVADP